MSKYRIYEIAISLCLVAFIIGLFAAQSAGTDKTAPEIAAEVIKVYDVSEMTEAGANDIINTFGISRDTMASSKYYCNKNIMNVSEMLIITLNDKNQADDVAALIEKRVAEQIDTFKSYAPDQVALLENSVIKTKGNAVFYCTGENAKEAYEAFKKAL